VAWAIYDVPLLFENGLQDAFDDIILVDVPEDTQLERLMLRDGLSKEQAQSRVASQWPMYRKRAQARWQVDNSQSLENTRRQVEDIFRSVSSHSPLDSSKP
jgi:dephospho-CoA kinase